MGVGVREEGLIFRAKPLYDFGRQLILRQRALPMRELIDARGPWFPGAEARSTFRKSREVERTRWGCRRARTHDHWRSHDISSRGGSGRGALVSSGSHWESGVGHCVPLLFIRAQYASASDGS